MAVGVAAARRLFTREEYHRMGEAGILKPTDRVELIRGEIVEMSPIGRRHYAFVNNLNQLLAVRLAGRAIVAVQGPIALADDTEPEPDVAIIRRRRVPYKEREAYAEDALLLIEVAESSLAYDRSTKLSSTPQPGFRSTGWSTVLQKASRSIARATPAAIATSAASLGPERLPCRRFPTSR